MCEYMIMSMIMNVWMCVCMCSCVINPGYCKFTAIHTNISFRWTCSNNDNFIHCIICLCSCHMRINNNAFPLIVILHLHGNISRWFQLQFSIHSRGGWDKKCRNCRYCKQTEQQQQQQQIIRFLKSNKYVRMKTLGVCVCKKKSGVLCVNPFYCCV